MPGMQDQDTQISEELITELRQMQYRYSQPAELLADHRSEDVRAATQIWARKAERIAQLITDAPHAWANADRLDALATPSSRVPEAQWRPAPADTQTDTQEVPRVH